MATELLASLEKESTVAESDTSFSATAEVCVGGVDEMDLVVVVVRATLSSGRMSLGSCVGRAVGPAKGATVKNGSLPPPKSPPRPWMACGSAQATPTSGSATNDLIAARRDQGALARHWPSTQVTWSDRASPRRPSLRRARLRNVVQGLGMVLPRSASVVVVVCVVCADHSRLVSTRNAAHHGERYRWPYTPAIAPEPGPFHRCPMHIAPGAIAPLSRRLAFPLTSHFSYL